MVRPFTCDDEGNIKKYGMPMDIEAACELLNEYYAAAFKYKVEMFDYLRAYRKDKKMIHIDNDEVYSDINEALDDIVRVLSMLNRSYSGTYATCVTMLESFAEGLSSLEEVTDDE